MSKNIYTTLINAKMLQLNLHHKNWLIVDCRYDLDHPEKGKQAYLKSHIPGAVFANLKNILDKKPGDKSLGRHPIVDIITMNAYFSSLGVSQQTQVIAYDDSGSIFAARFWWMLKLLRHNAVAVLDGGFKAWRENDFETENKEIKQIKGDFVGNKDHRLQVFAEDVPMTELLIDAREPSRYSGKFEPLDPVAGHIPGAINHYWKNNLQENLCFKEKTELSAIFSQLIGKTPAQKTVHYCGSGITACHNLLAFNHAGFPLAKLYTGSWSEWCADPNRPISTA